MSPHLAHGHPAQATVLAGWRRGIVRAPSGGTPAVAWILTARLGLREQTVRQRLRERAREAARTRGTTRLSGGCISAWRAFLTAHANLTGRIDQELVAANCVPLHWYDVLIELFEASGRRLRMSELASRVVLSRSTLTHLVDRMESAGLITRERCGTDRRGAYAVLTEQGVAALRQAWPVYARGIMQYFARHLHDAEAKRLTEIFQRVLEG